MNIFVIGSGGREHAICHSFLRSKRVEKIYCAPGNAGISTIAECIPINADDIDALADFAHSNKIDLTFVGGETSLALGVVDEFERRGLKIVGPNAAAARLESSKAFSKEFMSRHGVPTAKFATANSQEAAILILESGEFGDADSPVVVKADGLAAGKGVVVAADRAEAVEAINDMADLVGADAAATIIIEECLVGREISLLMFCDGENFALMPPTRDHKRIGEGDTGPNTGGMGTITDESLLTEDQTCEIVEKIIKPTLQGCRSEGFPFRGILFLGLMMKENAEARALARAIHPTPSTEDEHLQKISVESALDADSIALAYAGACAMVLEYNVRFGDPETQSILVRLETDLVDICEAMISCKSPRVSEGDTDNSVPNARVYAPGLAEIEIKWKPGNSATVVLAAKNYPQSPQKGDVIHGLGEASAVKGVMIFHAGTAMSSPGTIVTGEVTYITSGGRVLGVTAFAEDLDSAIAKAYSAIDLISWDGMQFRRDIGKTAEARA
ncbi:MAG: phosphoribosylamine--glycine ligase [Pyrinomonadaceae bacterium]